MNNPAGWDTSDSGRRRTPMVAQTALAYAARRCVFAFFLGSPVCR
ncbi:monoamine oxidase [Pseudomonas aeruginosa]|nr:monoamine oxidase [Pseudomonas aeruginosa]MCO2235796.1 monoamine oxidase [Pseudomonas aeruginosa]MCO2239972.1 monoamine oxidase [Pseudomonas aeruginosa]MCO2335506.1 monoamine oxidase [Pseudomonas aeruginosa]MCO2358276.1 monoamine oxidase [Pseudomonas aeruginosa]